MTDDVSNKNGNKNRKVTKILCLCFVIVMGTDGTRHEIEKKQRKKAKINFKTKYKTKEEYFGNCCIFGILLAFEELWKEYSPWWFGGVIRPLQTRLLIDRRMMLHLQAAPDYIDSST